jgi:two-component system OmpR family sensor kinase
MRGMRRRGLFWRVYLHGLLLLGLVTLALAVASIALGRPRVWGPYTERLGVELSARSAEVLGDSTVLSRDLRRDYQWFGLEVSVYDMDHRLRATGVTPPIPPLPGVDVAKLQGPRLLGLRQGRAAVPVLRGTAKIGYAVLRTRHLAPHVIHVVKVSAVILAFLALGSIPLARQITSPLETLTRTVERFGEGDLGVRAGMTRRDEVGDLGRAFDAMAGRLERLVRAEKEFLANVSHELRTPLARVRVALEIAAEGDEEKARACLREIAADLSELERLVGDILTMARLDLASGRAGSTATPLRRESMPAEGLLRQVTDRFAADHPERQLDLAIGPGLPTLSADPVLLRRALDNLLDNACKYSDADRPVGLAARAEGAGVEIAVCDRGIGLDAADQARLFTPFFRADRSRARDTGGVGLGLVLARGIVEAHGGTIAVESRLGEGTTFRVRLPSA